MSTPAISARSSAGGNEPHLLPGVRLPEPRGGDVLLPLRCPAGPRDASDETTLSLGPGGDRGGQPGDNIDGPALVVRSGGGRAGESFEAIGDHALIGRSPECDVFLDDVTVSRRHAELTREGNVVHDPRSRQPQRHLRQQAPDREQRARGRRRGPDRQIPDDVPAPMTTVSETSPAGDLHTIGAVCERLRDEFPDISISKIRYLEDQGLLQPKPDARRLPALLRGRRRAADHDSAPAARRVPAAARDPRGASRSDRRPGEAPCGRAARAGGGDRHDGAVRARGHLARVRASARGVQPARAADRGQASASTARATPTSRSRARRSPATGSTRATCARSARPPAASRRCSSRSSRRPSARATSSGAPRRSRISRRWPRSRRSWRSCC